MALLTFEMQPPMQRAGSGSTESTRRNINLGQEKPKKKWTAFLLFYLLLFFILGPQPSVLIVYTQYYLIIYESRMLFLFHLGVSYILLFMMLSSLIVCMARDPGQTNMEEEAASSPPVDDEDATHVELDERFQDEGMGIMDALLSGGPGDSSSPQRSLTPVEANGEKRWCRKCFAPKPERAHHCSECNRCVLKMDHHCPWLANNCVGARTYPSFLHFLFTSTLYSAYIVGISIPPLRYYLWRPFQLDDTDMTPFHAMTLALLGSVFTLSIGSFFIYHMYLATTNQTTLESLAPYLLLRHLPITPPAEDLAQPINVPPYDTAPPGLDSSRPPSFSSAPGSPTFSTPSHSPPPYAQPAAHHRSRTFSEPYDFPSPPLTPPFQPSRRLKEYELNRKQRRAVRRAAGSIRIYDLGWKENLKEVLGGPGPSASLHSGGGAISPVLIWVERIFWGGRGRGDGQTFRHNPNAEPLLRALGDQLAALG